MLGCGLETASAGDSAGVGARCPSCLFRTPCQQSTYSIASRGPLAYPRGESTAREACEMSVLHVSLRFIPSSLFYKGLRASASPGRPATMVPRRTQTELTCRPGTDQGRMLGSCGRPRWQRRMSVRAPYQGGGGACCSAAWACVGVSPSDIT